MVFTGTELQHDMLCSQMFFTLNQWLVIYKKITPYVFVVIFVNLICAVPRQKHESGNENLESDFTLSLFFC